MEEVVALVALVVVEKSEELTWHMMVGRLDLLFKGDAAVTELCSWWMDVRAEAEEGGAGFNGAVAAVGSVLLDG